MSGLWIYLFTGGGLIAIGVLGLIRQRHLLRKVLALNVVSGGLFLILIAAASRAPDGPPDPVPHAMVLTGIVVSISATAVGLSLAKKYHQVTGRTSLPDDEEDGDRS